MNFQRAIANALRNIVPAHVKSNYERAQEFTLILKELSRDSYVEIYGQTSDTHKITYLGLLEVEPDWDNLKGGWRFVYRDEIFARYKSARKVASVLTAIFEADKRGDAKFAFPKQEEF